MDIYILEDNIIQQGRLEQALDKALRSYGETLDCVQTFEQSNQLLEYIKPANHQQLFFLDIEIKGKEKEGLHLGQTIRNKLPDAHIVFVTSHSEFMPSTFSYQLFALDYIDKNLDEDSFQSKVAIALSYVAKQSIKKEEKFSFILEPTISISPMTVCFILKHLLKGTMLSYTVPIAFLSFEPISQT